MTTRGRSVAAGVLAGAVGTLAMDLVWYGRYRRGGGADGFLDWEFATSTPSFDQASAPGRVGQRIASMVGIRLPDSMAGTTTNVVHWLTGMGYGAGHGLLADGRHPLASGGITGFGAFANSYAALGLAGIYQPIWRYDRETIAKDLSAHLAFGLTTALVHRALNGGATAGTCHRARLADWPPSLRSRACGGTSGWRRRPPRRRPAVE